MIYFGKKTNNLKVEKIKTCQLSTLWKCLSDIHYRDVRINTTHFKNELIEKIASPCFKKYIIKYGCQDIRK